MTWHWDPTLYAGSAAYYARGRVPYPDDLAPLIARELGLDATQRLLDVGCGPGSATIPLAPYFGRAVGVDADPDMLTQAARLAGAAGVGNASWVLMCAEELPGGIGEVDVVTFAQSFHWMDQPLVARAVRSMLRPGGALLHLSATTHRDDRAKCSPWRVRGRRVCRGPFPLRDVCGTPDSRTLMPT